LKTIIPSTLTQTILVSYGDYPFFLFTLFAYTCVYVGVCVYTSLVSFNKALVCK